ncbi:MAG: MarR family transcriptional regulator [Bacteroidota bacterium]
MSNDLVQQLGYANLDTRLKRISDKMSHSLRAMYRELDMDTEPNWYLVFWIIREQPNASVTEIAARLQFTHQSVINMTNKMIKKGYLTSQKDSTDRRRTIFRLTKKTTDNFPRFTRIWEIGKKVTLELLDHDIAIMNHLTALERNLEQCSFGERIAAELQLPQHETTPLPNDPRMDR